MKAQSRLGGPARNRQLGAWGDTECRAGTGAAGYEGIAGDVQIFQAMPCSSPVRGAGLGQFRVRTPERRLVESCPHCQGQLCAAVRGLAAELEQASCGSKGALGGWDSLAGMLMGHR